MTAAAPRLAMGPHNLASAAAHSVEEKGEYPAVFFEGTWHSNVELWERSTRVASGLTALGIAPGDRVAVLMMNVPEVLVSYSAIWRAGAVAMPIIFLQTPPELRHILEDSGASAVIITEELKPLLDEASAGLDLSVIVVGDAAGAINFADLEQHQPGEIVPRADTDVAALLYTGGTTGRAKGVMLSHASLYATGAAMAAVGEEMGGTRMMMSLPLSHAYGLSVSVANWLRGTPSQAIMQRWFDAPSWLELAQQHRADGGPLVPTMMGMLLAEPIEDFDLSSLTSIGSGGAPLPPAVRDELRERMGVAVYEGYGCTETSAAATVCTPSSNRDGSVGRALPSITVTIVDDDGHEVPVGTEGEVCIGGAGVMTGYWNSPEQTEAVLRHGRFATGDIGKLDEDGFLYIVDRKKDLIIRGGFNVYPRDVEDVLLAHPAVTGAAVVGRPDPAKGEEVYAVVSVSPEIPVTVQELKDHAAAHLARYKYPRFIEIVDAVPTTSVGKIDRKSVRTRVMQSAASDDDHADR